MYNWLVQRQQDHQKSWDDFSLTLKISYAVIQNSDNTLQGVRACLGVWNWWGQAWQKSVCKGSEDDWGLYKLCPLLSLMSGLFRRTGCGHEENRSHIFAGKKSYHIVNLIQCPVLGIRGSRDSESMCWFLIISIPSYLSFYYCCNKLPQISGLKQNYALTVLDARVWNELYGAKIMM